MTHHMPIRVYYEDTDMAGIVYHANFLKFIERARSDWVRELGIDQRTMKEVDGQVFVVRRIECDYLAPAHYDDVLEVETITEDVTGVRLIMRQVVKRDGQALFSALVTVVVVNDAGVPQRLPARIRRQLH